MWHLKVLQNKSRWNHKCTIKFCILFCKEAMTEIQFIQIIQYYLLQLSQPNNSDQWPSLIRLTFQKKMGKECAIAHS